MAGWWTRKQRTNYLRLATIISIVILTIYAAMFLTGFRCPKWVPEDTGSNHDTQNVVDLLRYDGYDPVLVSFVRNSSLANRSMRASGFQVPNVVFFVWFGTDLDFTFVNYLSFRSAHRILEPDVMFVVGEQVPGGVWWTKTAREVPNLYHVKRARPVFACNGMPFNYFAHSSDYVRAELLWNGTNITHIFVRLVTAGTDYGGIYLDADVIVLKSFDALRKYEAVMGRESEYNLCNGIMISKRRAAFIGLMLDQYRFYRGPFEIWGEKSVTGPNMLSVKYPDLIHVEQTSLQRPNWRDVSKIHSSKYDWKANYAMHLWIRKWEEHLIPCDERDVQSLNTTIGEIARFILR